MRVENEGGFMTGASGYRVIDGAGTIVLVTRWSRTTATSECSATVGQTWRGKAVEDVADREFGGEGVSITRCSLAVADEGGVLKSEDPDAGGCISDATALCPRSRQRRPGSG